MYKDYIILEDIDIPKKRIPFSLRGNIAIVHKSSDRIIAGYANVAIVDDEDQFIPIKALKEGIASLLEDPHYANLMMMHGNIQVGKILESFQNLSTEVNDKGLFIVCQLRNDLEIANEIWDQIIKGEIRGFSIGCEVLDDHDVCDDEKCVKVLDKINIFEVSVCTEPINRKSGFEVISKSKFKEMHPNESMCKCNEKSDNMARKKKAEVVKAEEKEEPKEEEKSVEEEVKEETKTEKAEDTEEEKVEEKQSPEEDEPKEDTPEGTEETPEEEEYNMADVLKSIEDKINGLGTRIDDLLSEPEEKSEDKPEEEPEEPVEEPMEDKSDDHSIEPEISLDSLKKSVDTILERLEELSKANDIKTELKARDDQINALEKKLELVTKSKEEPVEEELSEPKTVPSKSEIKLKKDGLIIKKGTIYKKY